MVGCNTWNGGGGYFYCDPVACNATSARVFRYVVCSMFRVSKVVGCVCACACSCACVVSGCPAWLLHTYASACIVPTSYFV